jgi:hypothetical protein
METPRLLLASGLGNDWVGRNHHTHAGAVTVDAPVRKDYFLRCRAQALDA